MDPIVFDHGSDTCKVGFGGDDEPKYFIGSAKNQTDSYVGNAPQSMREILALNYPIKRGMITNWESMEKIWSHSLSPGVAIFY